MVNSIGSDWFQVIGNVLEVRSQVAQAQVAHYQVAQAH